MSGVDYAGEAEPVKTRIMYNCMHPHHSAEDKLEDFKFVFPPQDKFLPMAKGKPGCGLIAIGRTVRVFSE